MVPWKTSLLDRGSDHAAPLGPGAVVVADLVVAEQLFKDEPGVCGALADTAVGDDLAVVRDALAAIDLTELVRALEGAVLVDRGRPGDVHRGRDVAAPLGALLRQVLGGQQLAGVLLG